MKKIVALAGVMVIIALGAYTYSTLQQTRYAYTGPTMISVTGDGEVFAKPDIATFYFTIEAKDADQKKAVDAQAKSTEEVIAYLKQSGVDEKDIKTEGYNIGEWYENEQVVCNGFYCPPQNPKKMGTHVTQSITVKVRDTNKAGELLSGVGTKGALNVSGLSFTIDDTDKYTTEAREIAIKDAKEKAEVLAKNLGVRIVRMTGYQEGGVGYPMPYGGVMMDKAMGREAAMDSVAPQAAEVPSGETKVTSSVTLTYEIR